MTADDLQKLAEEYSKHQPSSPAWFHIIDHVVGTLLALEIERAKKGVAE